MLGYVEYSSNNSGGHWWLKDGHWKALEAAGWKVHWASLANVYTDGGRDYARDADGTPKLQPIEQSGEKFKSLFGRKDPNGEYRYLGALAKTAYRVGLPLRGAADEWERITGMDATDPGCPCCGQPHNFTEYDAAGKFVASGPTVVHSAEW